MSARTTSPPPPTLPSLAALASLRFAYRARLRLLAARDDLELPLISGTMTGDPWRDDATDAEGDDAPARLRETRREDPCAALAASATSTCASASEAGGAI